MKHTLEIELSEPVESAIEDILNELEEAIENIRKYRPNRITHEQEVDIVELLAEHHAIPIVWDVDHVRDQRPNLSPPQAWEVLQACQSAWERINDPMLELIRQTADELFPPLKGKVALRAYLAQIERRVEALPDDEAADPAAYGSVAAELDSVTSIVKGD